jgi:DNA-binding response OmpR family regulator
MKKKVLLVDDEPDIVSVFRMILETHNYQVIMASDGVEGLTKAVKERPDLILLDVKMPNKDGFTTLRELKHNDLTKTIPVVMLTVSQDESSMSGCLKDGATNYLFKTCDTQMFLNYIKKYIL